MDSQAKLNLAKLKLLSLGTDIQTVPANVTEVKANEPTSPLFMSQTEDVEYFCDEDTEDVEYFSDPESERDYFSEIEDADFVVSSHVPDASDADAETYEDHEDRWTQNIDSVKDICDYDSDTGICEY
ncbi:uncharacterized protein LOC119085291 [Bradysia coprophila]|uniref:uncharacterized protein LOC119085291 n=1 Tax=Bradysia coprophila TaxID=38358 RepID=UPI00187DB3A9|nr:uncharacterized protein LOC119085291 [Bradysia coprophila]